MGSLGGDDGEPKSSIERSSLADHAHMETQSDSQISTPPLFGIWLYVSFITLLFC